MALGQSRQAVLEQDRLQLLLMLLLVLLLVPLVILVLLLLLLLLLLASGGVALCIESSSCLVCSYFPMIH